MHFIILGMIFATQLVGLINQPIQGHALIACSILISVFVLIIAIEKAVDKICDTIKK